MTTQTWFVCFMNDNSNPWKCPCFFSGFIVLLSIWNLSTIWNFTHFITAIGMLESNIEFFKLCPLLGLFLSISSTSYRSPCEFYPSILSVTQSRSLSDSHTKLKKKHRLSRSRRWRRATGEQGRSSQPDCETFPGNACQWLNSSEVAGTKLHLKNCTSNL